MSTRDALLDEAGLRPGSATCAAVLGVLVGGGTLIGGAVVVMALLEHAGAAWFALLTWSVVVTQVVAAVLLITGGARLATGAGRRALIAGAALELLVCACYLLHALAVVASDTDETPETVAVFITIPVVVAAMTASSLLLALRSTTTEYLIFSWTPS